MSLLCYYAWYHYAECHYDECHGASGVGKVVEHTPRHSKVEGSSPMHHILRRLGRKYKKKFYEIEEIGPCLIMVTNHMRTHFFSLSLQKIIFCLKVLARLLNHQPSLLIFGKL